MLKRILNGLLSFVLPDTCLACGTVLNSVYRFVCPDCHAKLIKFDEPHPWKDEEISSGVIDDSFSLYQFHEGTEIQTLLHAFKYEKMKSVGRMFGKEIGERILSTEKTTFDYAVPVPLHYGKERERTYNQSLYISKGIKDKLSLKVLENCLERTRFTKTQTKLHKTQRQENVRGAFRLNPKFNNIIAGKNIILSDDVITTGSTILECARTLKAAGCGKILVCSIAYAVLD